MRVISFGLKDGARLVQKEAVGKLGMRSRRPVPLQFGWSLIVQGRACGKMDRSRSR